MKYFKLSCLLLSVILLSGCTSTKLPAITAYTLNLPDKQLSTKADARSNKIIRVALPTSSAAIMSRNILYQERGHSLNAYAFSKWSDTPNRMLANLFLSVIEDSAHFRGVLPAASRGKSDYVLESVIQQFHQRIEANGSSTASVRMVCYLIERNGGVMASREFVATPRTLSTDAPGAVTALNQAARQISIDMMAWLSTIKID